MVKKTWYLRYDSTHHRKKWYSLDGDKQLNCKYDGPPVPANEDHIRLIKEVCPHLEAVSLNSVACTGGCGSSTATPRPSGGCGSPTAPPRPSGGAVAPPHLLDPQGGAVAPPHLLDQTL